VKIFYYFRELGLLRKRRASTSNVGAKNGLTGLGKYFAKIFFKKQITLLWAYKDCFLIAKLTIFPKF